MTTKRKKGLAIIGLLAVLAAIGASVDEDYAAERAAMQAAAEQRETALEAAAERRQTLDAMRIYELSPEFRQAEMFGATLHVTVSAEFNRGWSVYPCSSQREFVSELFAEWKEINDTAHTVKLLNPGGQEIGAFSRIWGYHCGG